MSSSESNLTQLQTFEKKMGEMYEAVEIYMTCQTETRDKFLEEVREKMEELTEYSERFTKELETMNKSAELLEGIIERDDYLDQYKNIIGDQT